MALHDGSPTSPLVGVRICAGCGLIESDAAWAAGNRACPGCDSVWPEKLRFFGSDYQGPTPHWFDPSNKGPAPRPVTRTGDGIFVASRSCHAGLWQNLRIAGYPIISHWIDCAGPNETDWVAFWPKTIDEAAQAERVILYLAPGDWPLAKGGALLEAGAALGAKVPVFLVAEGTPDEVLGNWVKHPLILRMDSIAQAIAASTAFARSFQRSGAPRGMAGRG